MEKKTFVVSQKVVIIFMLVIFAILGLVAIVLYKQITNESQSNIANTNTDLTYLDKRLNNIVSENNTGIEKLRGLKIYTYTVKKDEQKINHVGVIAQDVQKIFPDAISRDNRGYYMMRREDLFYAMLNSVKQMDTIVSALVSEVKIDLRKINKYDAEIKVLKAQNRELQARIEKLENNMK